MGGPVYAHFFCPYARIFLSVGFTFLGRPGIYFVGTARDGACESRRANLPWPWDLLCRDGPGFTLSGRPGMNHTALTSPGARESHCRQGALTSLGTDPLELRENLRTGEPLMAVFSPLSDFGHKLSDFDRVLTPDRGESYNFKIL